MLHVNQAKYLEDYRVWLSFDNGISGEIDLFPELWGEMFEPLKDKALFSTVRLDASISTSFGHLSFAFEMPNVLNARIKATPTAKLKPESAEAPI